jgi:hypothetical protein
MSLRLLADKKAKHKRERESHYASIGKRTASRGGQSFGNLNEATGGGLSSSHAALSRARGAKRTPARIQTNKQALASAPERSGIVPRIWSFHSRLTTNEEKQTNEQQ